MPHERVTQAAASTLSCPRCDSPLFEGRASDVVLLGCGECAGIWLDNESAQLALKSMDRRITELSQRASSHAHAAPAKDARIHCPACKKSMPRVSRSGVDLDVCIEHGTWFDRGELVQIIEAMRPRAAPAPLHIIDVPLAPGEVPDFKAGTLTPDPVDAGLVIGGAFAVLGAILGAASK
jgi:Zn-finger nucleic acid-binding protein